MRSLAYILALLPILTFCASPSREKNEVDAAIVSTTEELTEYRYVHYDWDKNGEEDKFEFENYNEDVVIDLNGTQHKFSTISTVYEKFTEPSVLKYNQISDSAFIFIRLNPETEALLLKDKGDFSGPVLNVWAYGPDNTIRKIWDGTGEFIEVADLDNNGSLEFIMEDIQSEPGFTAEYVFVDFTFFKVYTFRDDQLTIETELSHNYNLRHKPLYEKTLGMEKPVLARSIESTATDFDLILDLNKINKLQITTE